MGAQIRIMPTEEVDQGFGLLKDIVEMVKNPKAIDEAYERRRKAAELTDDEVKKADEARALIEQAEALRNELKKENDALEARKSAHETNVLIHRQHVDAETKRLTEWEERLDIIKKQQDETSQSHIKERADIDADARKVKEDKDKKEAEFLLRERAVKDGKAANIKEAERLAELAAKLKAKAARLAVEAANEV